MNGWRLALMGDPDRAAVDAVEAALRKHFPAPVERRKLEDPAFAYDGARRQYGSVEVLRRLIETAPADSGERVLGITERDLFIPMLTFVFGQAQLGGRAAVISLARLRQEFYGMGPDAALLALRASKEALHECGHMLGLAHCEDRRCVMSLATGIRALDEKGDAFCASCFRIAVRRAGADRVRET